MSNGSFITEVISEVTPEGNGGDRVPLSELIAEMRNQRDRARAEVEQLKKEKTALVLKVAELTVKLAKGGSQVKPKPPAKPTFTISDEEIARVTAMFGLK